MLSEVLRKYQTFKKAAQKSNQAIKQKLEEQFEAKTIQSLKIQNHKVSKIHSNQQEIENKLRRNAELQAQLKMHLGGWLLMHQELGKAMKEAGDIVNYAKYVEEEIRQMNEQLMAKMKLEKQHRKLEQEPVLQQVAGQQQIIQQ